MRPSKEPRPAPAKDASNQAAHDDPEFSWDHEVDLLVLGSGAGGLSAALFGTICGAKVLLCEKTSQVGGTTASSGGIVWAPGNLFAKDRGIDDPADQVRTYLKGECGRHYNAELADAFIESAPKAVATLHARTEAKFAMTQWPDYHSDRPGAAQLGRSLEAQRFDGRRLGKAFTLVRPPLPPLMLFGGMQVDKRKVDDFLNPFGDLKTLLRILKTLARYGLDRLSYPRGTELGAGNAMVAAMLYSLLQGGAEVWTNSPIEKLVRKSGTVVGGVIRRNGRTMSVGARRGVILATGGFPSNKHMREELSARFPHDITFGFEGDVGDGINVARAVGAVLDDDVDSSAYWQPSSKLRLSDGREQGVLYGYLDRGRPGVVAVDRTGRRFVNEANSYHDVGLALIKAGSGEGNIFHFVCDRTFVWHHGLGMIRPFTWNLRGFERMGYIAMAGSVVDLAAKIGVDPKGLSNTIANHNAYAATGVDLEFGKGSTAYNRLFGSKRAGPNPNLAPIKKPPFVALRIYPGTLGTAIGLRASGNAQIMDGAGKPITGLYACGNDMASAVRGCYPAGGATLGPAIAFAYRAVAHALGAEPESFVSAGDDR
ncbi:MAG: FAD-dependent oxidoreductase [Mesorhizobium sp.]|nr:MAG: FAD-dependent oxidoreductase [Mesorhizobium sp.]